MDIAELLPLAGEFQFRSVVEILRHSPIQAKQRISEIIARSELQPNNMGSIIEQSRMEANLAIAALTFGIVEPILKLASRTTVSPGREYLIHLMTPSRLDFERLRYAIAEYADHPDLVAVLLLASGKYSESTMSSGQSHEWQKLLNHLYLTSGDREVHSIAGLLLRRRNVDTTQLDKQLALGAPAPLQEWYVDPFGQTMLVFDKDETSGFSRRHGCSFAVSSTEVPVELFLRFFSGSSSEPGIRAGGAGSPVTQVQKSRMAEFCNCLSRDAGIDVSQWCYPAVDEAPDNFSPVADCLDKSGYRLATVEELAFLLQTSSKPGWLQRDARYDSGICMVEIKCSQFPAIGGSASAEPVWSI
ncbi:MAG: hypothetical protein U0936_02230 [Planctomycetaceae bacterium]